VFNGEKALQFIAANPPDLVTLDVEMPGMDGLQVLEAIQQLNRTRPAADEIGVLMLSAYTRRGAEVTMRALQAGAFDFVAKPHGPSVDENTAQLRREVAPRIRLFLARRARIASSSPAAAGSHRDGPDLPVARHVHGSGDLPARSFKAILIGCSTGGPKALVTLLPQLRSVSEVPVLIVQHMPAEFTRSLAESLARQTGLRVVEAQESMPIEPGGIYLAPGGRHLKLRRDLRGTLMTGISDEPPESGCRPSASVLFRSAADLLGPAIAVVILTGMGTDGTSGLATVKRQGGLVIAQDEASSVVWGMPGSAVAAGYVDAVVPLNAVAQLLQSVTARRSSG
jgi:two-component system chemotaxis response regulator CheB